ncbi:MAG: hypothetical protein ACOX1O_04615 [Eggerthellaceae bacterium]|jgi:hypothetical protein
MPEQRRPSRLPRGAQQANPHIPDDTLWPDLPEPERDRRRAILADIRRRVAENGPRRALRTPDRANQFLPFAALKGYDEMLAKMRRSVEREKE